MCNCPRSSCAPQLEDHLPLFERFQFREVMEASLAQTGTMKRLVAHLASLERAEALGLDAESDKHKKSIERESSVLKLHAAQLATSLSERTQRADWDQLKQRADALINSAEVSAIRRQLQDRVNEMLVDTPYNAVDVVEVRQVWSGMFDGLGNDGVQHLVDQLNESADRAQHFADDPPQLLAPASPLEQWQVNCLLAVGGFWLGVLVVCCFTCWAAVIPLFLASVGGLCAERGYQ
jgi:hypothetical protein